MDLDTLLIGVAILLPYIFLFYFIKNSDKKEIEESFDEEAVTSKTVSYTHLRAHET